MSNSAEKLVKQTIKLLSKTQELDYEELKMDAKKLIRAARNFDESILGMMESIMDLGNVGAEEELEDFDPEVLKIYCRIKEIDDSGSDRTLRARVWNHIEEEFELSESESEDEEESEASDEEPEPEPEPVKHKKSKKPKEVAEKEVVIIG